MKHNNIWKLAAVLAVVIALAGIWAIKNAGALKASGMENGKSPESSEIGESAEISDSAESLEGVEASESMEASNSAETPESTETSESAKSSESSKSTKTSETAKSSVSAEASKSARTESAASSQKTQSAAGTESSSSSKTPASTESFASSKAPVDTNNADFALEATSIDLKHLTSHGLPIIIDFGADWCGPCLKFAPIYEAVHDDMLGSAILKYVDIDQSGDVANKYPVKVIPTQVFFLADGTPYVPSGDIDVDFLAYNDKTTGKRLFTTHEGALTEKELNAILKDMGASE